MLGNILRAGGRIPTPLPPSRAPHTSRRSWLSSTALFASLAIVACADPAAPPAFHPVPLDSTARAVRVRRPQTGIETIGEGTHPAATTRLLREQILNARRSPLIPIDVSIQGLAHSGEFVHPDLVIDGGRQFLMFTGYPLVNSALRTYDARAENPTLVVSDEWNAWRPPVGTTREPLFPAPADGYNSDGTLLVDPIRRVFVAFNRLVSVRGSTSEQNIIEVRRSSDRGATWSAARETMRAPSHRLVSPDFLMDGPNYQMWAVDAGPDGCRAKSSIIQRYSGVPSATNGDSIVWSGEQQTDWVQPGWIPWHIDVSRVGDFYFGLAAAYPAGSTCARIEVFGALSTDGVHWLTLGEPLERVTDVAESTASLYRATSVFDAKTRQLTIAFSAASGPTFAWENFRRQYGWTEVVSLFREFGNRFSARSTAKGALASPISPELAKAYRRATRGFVERPR